MTSQGKAVKEYVGFCMRHQEMLNAWERGFVSDVRGFNFNKLSRLQKKTLMRITSSTGKKVSKQRDSHWE
jgi:hypothetical protein